MSRVINHEIMPEIKKRWSPRAFSNKSIAADKLKALLEAARYAPSCNNEQPWRFLIADSDEMLTRMRSILNTGNQEWANKAPVLITHAMGGFDREKARSEFKIPEEYEIISVIAVGYYGDKSELSDFNQSREHPQMRKEIDNILL